MIYVLAPGPQLPSVQLVADALARSCSADQVRSKAFSSLLAWLNEPDHDRAVWCVINPLPEWSDALIRLCAHQSKLLLLGQLPAALARHLGMECAPLDSDLPALVNSAPAPSHGQSESALRIRYRASPLSALSALEPLMLERPLLRYDFTDEWNNLGYGAVRADGSPWALCQTVRISNDNTLAELVADERVLGAYAGLWTMPNSSVLWFNRTVGPIDSHEWRLVEDFFSCHRAHELPCIPVLCEVPHGFDAAVTMRLDCDEDVESARALWHVYQAEAVPFSLALHSKVLADAQHHTLAQEVLAAGGAVLSHTATHAPDWGGSYAAAFEEGRSSAQHIEAITGQPVRYAVSPFHQTPVYARWGLADAGYKGCIGGIVRNDFDFLMARSGRPPSSPEGFIGHSQQCMLHGDCMLEGSDPLAVFKRAFDLASASGAWFGYLDHPFSERYQYGWTDEAQRSVAHQSLIQYIRQQGRVLFLNEEQTMDFLYRRAHTRVHSNGDRFEVTPPADNSPHLLQLRWRGKLLVVPTEGLIL